MAKKQRSGANEPSSSAVPSRDVLQRLNYLYQVSILLSTSLPPSSSSTSVSIGSSSKNAAPVVVDRMIPTQHRHVGLQEQGKGLDTVSAVKDERSKRRKRQDRRKEKSALPALAQMMVKTMKEVAKKAVVRMYVFKIESKPVSPYVVI